MRMRKPTWIQMAPRSRAWGLGIAPGDIGFTGPLTPEQQQTLDANQTQNIANFFYQQGQMDAQSSASSSFSSFLQQNQNLLLYAGIGLVGLVFLKKVLR